MIWFDLSVVAVLTARADKRPFYLRHVEYSSLVVAVEDGKPPTAGSSLVAHHARDRRTGALMFREEPKTQNIVTVDGGLCITDHKGIIRCD